MPPRYTASHVAHLGLAAWLLVGCGEPTQTAGTDAGPTTPPGFPGPRAVTPAAWEALATGVSLTLERDGQVRAVGVGDARLSSTAGTSPYHLRITSAAFPTPGAALDCSVSLSWYVDLPIYSLDRDAARARPCTLRGPTGDTALVFTHALVALDPAGRLTVRLEDAADAPVALTLTYTP